MQTSSGPGLYDHARQFIPYGSSTISKAPRYLPEEPAAIVRGRGCRVWDSQGREFIDFRNGLGPVTLGYCYPAVDAAIRKQLESGIVFGHPHPLEAEVAEKLCSCIPCAQQARFLKTGGEAIAACIRIARASTGREHVIHVGYNGWLNSLAADGLTLPNQPACNVPPGVPAALSRLHHAAAWADVDELQQIFDAYPDDIAAVVIAAQYAHMADGKEYYPAVRAIADTYGSVLIFDEIVTGFRVATGGVSEYFGVQPDLAAYAKGVANGMPLSVYAGRRELMQQIEQGVSISSTYAGEALSLAACNAVIDTYQREHVVDRLWQAGTRWQNGANSVFESASLPVRLQGLPVCPQMVFDAAGPVVADLPERLIRAAYRHGLSMYTVTYVTYSHADGDIDESLSRLSDACRDISM